MSTIRTVRLLNGRLVLSNVSGFWKIGNDPSIPNLPLETSAPAGIVADLSITDEADTISAAGVVDVAATISASDAADQVSAAGAVDVVAVVSTTDAADTITAAGTVAPLVDDQPVSLGGRDKWDRWRQDWMEAQPARAAMSVADGDDTISAAGAVWWRLRVVSSRMKDDSDTVEVSAAAAIFRRPGGLVRYTQKAELRRSAR